MVDETVYLAVNFMDRFLSQMAVLRGKLQLVGTAAMLISRFFVNLFQIFNFFF
jgi:cyclin-A